MLNKPGFMFDIETFGTKPGDIITSIGVVNFNPEEKGLGPKDFCEEDKFEVHIKIEDSVKKGFGFSASTLLWWIGQSEEARTKLVKGQETGIGVLEALQRLSAWMGGRVLSPESNAIVYGNSASFDITLLESYFTKMDLPIPWSYRKVTCYRTLIQSKFVDQEKRAELGRILKKELVAHDALDDAIYQTILLQNLL